MLKLCECCGEEYKTRKKNRKYCSKKCFGKSCQHEKETRKCLICQNTFEVLKNSNKKLCSVGCSNIHFSNKFVGKGNPNYGKTHPNMFVHTEEAKIKIKTSVSNHWKTDDRKKKHKIFMERYKNDNGHYHLHSKDARNKISNKIVDRLMKNESSVYVNSNRGYYKSEKTGKMEYFQSSYEKTRMMEYDRDKNVKFWTKKHEFVIVYGNGKRYYPDFFIEYIDGKLKIEEIKGYIKDEESFVKKSTSALEFFAKNGMEYDIIFPNQKNFKNQGHLLQKIFKKHE